SARDLSRRAPLWFEALDVEVQPVFAGADPILRQRVGAATGGAEAALRDVQIDQRLGPRPQLMRVRGGEEIGRREVADRGFAWLCRREADACPLALQRQPAQAGAVAVLLRDDVGDVLAGDGSLEPPEPAGAVAVRIGVAGAEPEPFHRLEAGRRSERHAEPR